MLVQHRARQVADLLSWLANKQTDKISNNSSTMPTTCVLFFSQQTYTSDITFPDCLKADTSRV